MPIEGTGATAVSYSHMGTRISNRSWRSQVMGRMHFPVLGGISEALLNWLCILGACPHWSFTLECSPCFHLAWVLCHQLQKTISGWPLPLGEGRPSSASLCK